MNQKILSPKLSILPLSAIFIIFIFLLLISPQYCQNGIATGLLICSNILIPSLFPFTVCILFLLRTNFFSKLYFLDKITNYIFGLPSELFFNFIFSCIGGYPIGAKLKNSSVEDKKISPESAGKMLSFCINAGPSFIITAIGSGILGSKRLGILLFFSHITASLLICLALRNNKFKIEKTNGDNATINIFDNFVLSVSEASVSMITICSYVILFSVINAYINFFSLKFPFLKPIALLLEVTNASTYTNNIYLISFLLGFGGVCIWCQIFSIGKALKIEKIKFILFRIVHGILSALITFLLIKFTKIPLPTFSNQKSFSISVLYSTPSLSLSMIIMCIILLISFTSKKITGKILEDMV